MEEYYIKDEFNWWTIRGSSSGVLRGGLLLWWEVWWSGYPFEEVEEEEEGPFDETLNHREIK